jgi:putative transposase
MEDWPVAAPDRWPAIVNRPARPAELDALEISIKRSRPYGDDRWTLRTAKQLGLESTLRPRGRQRLRGRKDS